MSEVDNVDVELPPAEIEDGEIETSEVDWQYVEDDELEDDLYGDLETNIFERTTHDILNTVTIDELNKRIEELENMLKKFVKVRIELKNKVRSLTKENFIILSNAKSLYETARFEIERKNSMLSQLQKRLQELVKRKGPGPKVLVSGEDLEDVLQKCSEISRETSDITSAQAIRKAVEEYKKKSDEKQKKAREKCVWSKKIHFNNISVYFHTEQIPFGRLEQVTFSKPNKNQHLVKGDVPKGISVEATSKEIVQFEQNQETPNFSSKPLLESTESKSVFLKTSVNSTDTNTTTTASLSGDIRTANHNPSRKRSEERHGSSSRDNSKERRYRTSSNHQRTHYYDHPYGEPDRSKNSYSHNYCNESRRSPGKRRRSRENSSTRRSNSRVRTRYSDSERFSKSSRHQSSNKYHDR